MTAEKHLQDTRRRAPLRRPVKAFAAAAVLLVACHCVYAQSGGTIRGLVTDKGGAAMPGAVVTLRSARNPAVDKSGTVTDARGEFRLLNMPPGNDYHLSASFPGMGTIVQGPIQVQSGVTRTVNFILLEELVTRIKVEGQGAIVDTKTATTSTVVSEAFIATLPILGRSFTDLLTLAPGVTDTDGDGKPNVHGAREVDFQTRLDGVNITDPFSGEDTSQINIEAIEEVQILTTGASAEYGRFQGGVGIATTKSGGNEFEGSFKFFYQTRIFDSDGAANQDAVTLDDDPDSFRTIKPFLTVGGALRRDRAWYFLANQYIDQQEPLNILGFQRNNNIEGWNEFGKLTWQITPSHKGILEGLYDPRTYTGNNLDLGISPLSDYTYKAVTPVVTLRESWVASPTVLLDSALSYLNGRQSVRPVAELSTGSLECKGISDPVDLERFCGPIPKTNYTLDLKSNQVEGPYWVSQDSDASRLTLKQDLSFYVDDFLGSHQFKAGFEWVDEQYDTLVRQRPLRYDLEPGRQFQYILFADFEARTQSAEAGAETLGVYFQDTWSLRPNLTLNVGVRLDNEKIQAPGQTPIDPAAERAAFDALARIIYADAPLTLKQYAAWVEKSTGFLGCPENDLSCQQVGPEPLSCDIAGPDLGPPDGFCDSWDRIATSRLFSRHEAEQGTSQFFTQNEVEFQIPPCDSPLRWGTCRGEQDINLSNTNLAPRLSIAYDPFSDGKTKLWATYGRFYDRLFLAALVPEQARDFTYISFKTPVSEDKLEEPTQKNFHTYTVSRDLRTPFVNEVTVGFQRELTPEFSVSARYIRRRGRDQIQKRDINHFTIDTDGDGFPDDETGDAEEGGVSTAGADGFPDLYPYNPFYGGVFIVGNFNTSDYRGFEVSLTRRLHRNWQFDASYTYSEALGNAEEFEDLYLGSDTSQVQHEFGYLSYDQRHAVKFNAVAHFPKDIQFGTRILWESGLPFSLIRRGFTYDSNDNPTYRQIFPTQQRNDQRNTGRWLIDLNLHKGFSMGRSKAGVDFTVTNLLNSDDLEIGNINDASSSLQLVSGTERRFGRRFQIGFTMNF